MKNQLLPVPEGYKAIVHHAFNADDVEFWTRLAHVPVNGKLPKYLTVVDVIDRTTGEVMVTGYAKCSARDNPSRKLGRLIAHNRAVEAFVNRKRNHAEDVKVTKQMIRTAMASLFTNENR